MLRKRKMKGIRRLRLKKRMIYDHPILLDPARGFNTSPIVLSNNTIHPSILRALFAASHPQHDQQQTTPPPSSRATPEATTQDNL